MKTILIAVLIGLSAMACKDRNDGESYNPQLPPITQTGANTFGAIINGKVMIPRNSIGYQPPGSNHYAAKYHETEMYYDFGAANLRDNNIGSVYIYLRKQNKANLPLATYQFLDGISYNYPTDTAIPDIMMHVFLNDNNNIKTYLSISNTGSIQITKNDNNIISGTFFCKLKNKDNPNDIIEVKNGRFDFDKNTINTTNFP